jgi:Protein of unknown function (DUF4230)
MDTGSTSQTKASIPGFIWVLIGALLSVALVSAAIWLATGVGLFRIFTGSRDGRIIHADQPTVVRQIQQLQRLETVRYTMDKIISGEHENAYLPKFLAGDRLLLIVHGEVIGGVDLTKLQPGDVSVHGRQVTVHLPSPEILVTRLDNSKTRVYSRDTGLFSFPDPNLESAVREEAERQLEQAAQQDGILKSAEQNAREALTAILKGLGFAQIEFS